jgi:hypothetical protein
MARTVTLSAAAVLALGGGAGWLVGSSALDAGTGTVVLAAGIAVTVWLVVVGSRDAAERPMERWRSRRLLRLAVVGVIGALLVPASSLLGDRAYLLLGAALLLLAALGAFLALNSVGQLYPRGLVGLGAGALLWAASAYRSGLVARLRGTHYR